MRTIAIIDGISTSIISESQYESLCAILPEGRHDGIKGIQHGVFRVEIDSNDPRLNVVLGALHQAGLKPWKNRFRKKDKTTEYTYFLRRAYSIDELDNSELLRLHPTKNILAFTEAAAGELEVQVACLRDAKSWDFATAMGQRVVVSNRVKQLLEALNLIGIAFRSTVPVRGGYGELGTAYSWSQIGDPWWELTSSIELSRVSPKCDLRDNKGRKVLADFSNGCFLHEPPYVLGELRYRQRDIIALGPFGLARTKERWGSRPGPDDRWLIASHEFYRFCREHKLKCEWIPVHIDDD